MSNNNVLIKKGYSTQIIIETEDNPKMINASKLFLEKLERNYLTFIEELNKNQESWDMFVKGKEKNDKVLFKSEKILKKSPMTIINAPWGSGKTHFIENFAKNFAENEIESSVFERIVILDVWRYANSTNVPDEIMAELFVFLSSQNDKLKKDMQKWAKKTFNVFALPWIQKFGIKYQRIRW